MHWDTERYRKRQIDSSTTAEAPTDRDGYSEFDPDGGRGRMRDVESLSLLEDIGVES